MDQWQAIASDVLTILVFISIIAIPAVFIFGGAINQAGLLFRGLEIDGLHFSFRNFNVWLDQTIQTVIAGNIHLDEFRFAESLSQAIGWFSDWLIRFLVSFGQSLPRLFTNALVVLVILYVFLSR